MFPEGSPHHHVAKVGFELVEEAIVAKAWVDTNFGDDIKCWQVMEHIIEMDLASYWWLRLPSLF
jgi:hypothetical protein